MLPIHLQPAVVAPAQAGWRPIFRILGGLFRILGGRLVGRTLAFFAVLFLVSLSDAMACPFCSVIPRTLSDELEESTAAVAARCVSVSAKESGFSVCRMRVTEVFKGGSVLDDTMVEILSEEEHPTGKVFLLLSFGESKDRWVATKEISKEAVAYLQGLRGLPREGSQRLRHFVASLQSPEEMIAADAYNEFAEASMEEVIALKAALDRNWIIAQLRDNTVPVHRRRLCWTLLSQCGKPEDVSLFDESIRYRQKDTTFDPGMDAAIACYLTLGGERALSRIEREILSNTGARYTDTFAAVSAIRVHGTELKRFPRERLIVSLRKVLDRADLADIVIPDLARWEDWSLIDRMVALFEQSSADGKLVKPAVVLYLKVCPLPEAAKALQRLRTLAPAEVQLAESSMLLNPGLPAVPVPPPVDDTSSTKAAASATTNEP